MGFMNRLFRILVHAALPALAVAGMGLAGSGGCTSSPSPGGIARDWASDPAVFTLTGSQEIDALSDVHGDLDVTIRVLSAAGLITAVSPYHWTGGARVLVVTGDII